jgi:serine acetyltransferase
MNESKIAMPEKSSADTAAWPVRVRLIMLTTNALPVIHAAFCVWLAWRVTVIGAVLLLYLLPPLLTRCWMMLRRLPAGTISASDPGFVTWWLSAQAQMIFNRLPMLEELLRLVPGLYSFWMRLWGAKIGRLTFWGPHTRIVDRPLLIVGDDVVIGGGCQIGSHLVVRGDSGMMTLQVAAVQIGDRALVGTYAMIGPGVIIEPDAEVRACAIVPPFNRWRGDKRVKPEST